jgi:hypothetical protein
MQEECGTGYQSNSTLDFALAETRSRNALTCKSLLFTPLPVADPAGRLDWL